MTVYRARPSFCHEAANSEKCCFVEIRALFNTFGGVPQSGPFRTCPPPLSTWSGQRPVNGLFDLPFVRILRPVARVPASVVDMVIPPHIHVRRWFAFIVRWFLPRAVSRVRPSCPHTTFGSAPSLRASRVVTLVDGLPRASKFFLRDIPIRLRYLAVIPGLRYQGACESKLEPRSLRTAKVLVASRFLS